MLDLCAYVYKDCFIASETQRYMHQAGPLQICPSTTAVTAPDISSIGSSKSFTKISKVDASNWAVSTMPGWSAFQDRQRTQAFHTRKPVDLRPVIVWHDYWIFAIAYWQALTPVTFDIVALINKAPHVAFDCSYSPVTDIFFSRWSLEIVIPVRFPRSEGTIYFLLFFHEMLASKLPMVKLFFYAEA